MKKILSILIVVVLSTGISVAQNLKDGEVPLTISKNFKSEYSHASDTEWDKEGDNYAVTFTVSNQQEVHLVYDEKGSLKEKYMALPKKDILPSINKYINSNYPGQMVRNCWVRQAGSRRVYKVEILENNIGMGTISGSYNGLSAEAQSSSGSQSNIHTDAPASTSINSSIDIPKIIYFDMNGNPIESDSAAFNGKEVILDTASIETHDKDHSKSKDNRAHKNKKSKR